MPKLLPSCSDSSWDIDYGDAQAGGVVYTLGDVRSICFFIPVQVPTHFAAFGAHPPKIAWIESLETTSRIMSLRAHLSLCLVIIPGHGAPEMQHRIIYDKRRMK